MVITYHDPSNKIAPISATAATTASRPSRTEFEQGNGDRQHECTERPGGESKSEDPLLSPENCRGDEERGDGIDDEQRTDHPDVAIRIGPQVDVHTAVREDKAGSAKRSARAIIGITGPSCSRTLPASLRP